MIEANGHGFALRAGVDELADRGGKPLHHPIRFQANGSDRRELRCEELIIKPAKRAHDRPSFVIAVQTASSRATGCRGDPATTALDRHKVPAVGPIEFSYFHARAGHLDRQGRHARPEDFDPITASASKPFIAASS